MKSLKGHLLIAKKALSDPIFARTVVLMLEHSSEGAAGVVLNRVTPATVEDLSREVFDEHVEWTKPIHMGGPVAGPLMILHRVEELADRHVFADVYSSVDSDKIRALVDQRPDPCFIVANYSGWGPGQLENEIEHDSWYLLPALDDHVFCAARDELWNSLIRQINHNHLQAFLGLGPVPIDPETN